VPAARSNPEETDSILRAPPPDGPIEPGPVPTFSVIIAAYNTADTVGDAIESALAQTVPPHEVIVCDDGSTDGIEGAVEPYRDRIIFLREEHRGESATKNSAVSAATGDFISVLDSDDTYLPERNEVLGQCAAARPDLDIITTNSHMVVDGEVVKLGEENWVFDPEEDQRQAILERCFIFPAVVVRRSRLLEVGGFDESIVGATDWDAWVRLILTGSKVGWVVQPLARYGLRPESLSSHKALMARSAVACLSKAENMEMSAEERAVLSRSLETWRGKLSVESAREAIRDRSPDARRLSLEVAKRRSIDIRTRAKAAVSVLAPGIGGRLLQSRERKRWIGAGNVPVARRDER
jgi:hypothetical protein